jgi:hypothetical protein
MPIKNILHTFISNKKSCYYYKIVVIGYFHFEIRFLGKNIRFSELCESRVHMCPQVTKIWSGK